MFSLNKLNWKINRETPQSYLEDILKIICKSQESTELCYVISHQFYKLFSVIYSNYYLYRFYNPFKWTIAILQLILVKHEQTAIIDNLTKLVKALIDNSSISEYKDLNECYVVVNSIMSDAQYNQETCHLKLKITNHIDEISEILFYNNLNEVTETIKIDFEGSIKKTKLKGSKKGYKTQGCYGLAYLVKKAKRINKSSRLLLYKTSHRYRSFQIGSTTLKRI